MQDELNAKICANALENRFSHIVNYAPSAKCKEMFL